MFPKTLFRYCVRSYIMRLGIVMSIVSVGLLLAGAFDVLTRFRSTNLTTTLFLKLIMMKLPYVLVATLPLITFITTLVFLYYLSKSNEIVSIFNIGSSLWHVLSPTLISVFVVGAVGVTMVQPISSVLLNNYEKMEIKLLKKKIDPVIRMENGVIVAEDYDDHKRFITAQIVDVPNKTLSNLSIFFIDNFNDEVKGDSNSRIDASSGVIENGVIILKNAKIFRTVVPEIVEEMKLKTNLTINRFVENVAPPESSSFWELPGKIRNLSAAGMYPTKYKLYYFKLFFEPLMMIALSMFAVIFMNRSQERIYGMKKIFIGLGMGFVLYLLSEISIPILTYHGMGPMAATLCPIALIAMLSVFLILHLHEL